MIDPETLQKMWEKDSKIDMDNLHQESSNICSLHAKYYDIYNNLRATRSKADQKEKIYDTIDMSTSREKQITKFIKKIHFLKK